MTSKEKLLMRLLLLLNLMGLLSIFRLAEEDSFLIYAVVFGTTVKVPSLNL